MAHQTLCNKCGRVIDGLEVSNGISIHTTMGYGSQNDGLEVDVDFCTTCSDQLIGKLSIECKVPVLKEVGVIN